MKNRIWYLLVGLILLSVLTVACAPTPTLTPVPPTPIRVVSTIAPTSVAPSTTPSSVQAFNFAKGTTWVYEGVVQWDEKSKAQQKTLTWKMQVVDKIERSDGIVGYVMKGHPIDLAFYDAAKQPSDYLYIVKANRVYQITLIDTKPIDRMRDAKDALTDFINDETIVYDFPLAANKKFGPPQFLSAGSLGKYIWIVAETNPTKLTVKGIASTDATEYRLNYATNPDWQSVYYVPSIGITQFVYHHNGTLSEVDVKLVEISKP